MTLVQLETILEADATTLSRYLNGKSLPEIDFLKRLYKAVEMKAGVPPRPEVAESVRKLYFAACAVHEPARHQVYFLRDAVKEARNRAEAAEELAWEMRAQLNVEQVRRQQVEQVLHQLQSREMAMQLIAAKQELQKAIAERDRLNALIEIHSQELGETLRSLQVTERARAHAQRLLHRAESELEAELERRWALSEPVAEEVQPQSKRRWRWRWPKRRNASASAAERPAASPERQWIDLGYGLEQERADQLLERTRRLGELNMAFTRLTRENQAMIQRQIVIISDLKSRESDPERLANLFHLDQLATRVRRAGDNILILAGRPRLRRPKHPVPLGEVLRAAISEVKDHERLRLQDVPHVEIKVNVVTDLVHLLAELMENAANFSPPSGAVRVIAHLLPDSRVLIELRDEGLGFAPDALADVNERLASFQPRGADPFSIGFGQVGIPVVAVLSSRTGIRVQLRPNENSGTIALVMVPGDAVHKELVAGGDTPHSSGGETPAT
ncbi:ATP-binding protein [Streptomyces sp. NBC_00893]|uniref:ATP-binding protein n=1 Tax=Streptomyces sp. NBC_00893 TaxID=2975862 RepID=UPI002259E101|nr:ATP-binding protein [Streptomyces sp. NBC_00893]